jgi:deoxyribonucleoside regulator
MHKGNEDTRRRATEISRLFFEQNLSKSEISRRKGISVTHVNRILKEAGQLGILQVTVKIPRRDALENELRDAYQLRHVRVIQSSEDKSTTRAELATIAAVIFDEVVKHGMSVGLSSGRTLFEMASRLADKPRSIQVFPLNVIIEKDVAVHGPSANTVATIAWFRSRPDGEAFHVELFAPAGNQDSIQQTVSEMLRSPQITELRSRVDNLDAYFLTTSLLRPDSLLAELWQTRGLTDRDLRSRRMVGDAAFNVFDERGMLVTSGLEDLMFKVDFGALKNAAASVKPVVMIAGIDKSGAVLAAARGKLFNTLVTDSDTAEYLLRNKDRRGFTEVA